MKRIIFLIIIFVSVKLTAIVPPRVPGLKIPEVMLENIKRDPYFYMPGVALSKKMQLYRQRMLASSKGRGEVPDPVVGYIPVLCLQYADVDSEWTTSQMADQLFDEYSNWPTGSMKDYYEEISYGAFTVSGGVYGWIQVTGDKEYYNRENGHTGELIIEGLTLSDSEINFALYDNDGPDGIPDSGDDDGYVDQLVVIHSGIGGEYGGPEIWSHSWSLQDAAGDPFTTDDLGFSGDYIKVDGYIIQPAVKPTGEMEEIGVFCHEYGHALGLPDLYDRDGSSEGVGNWALMAGGGSDYSRPSHMCAWSKELLGWVTPIVLTENMYNNTIPAVEDTAVVYKLWTHGEIEPYWVSGIWGGWSVEVGKEYFLIENRQKKKFDNQLPGEGLLIWHIRNSVLTQNDDETNKLVDLEAADNFMDLDMGKNRGDDGDPFPGSTNNRMFNRSSFPNSNVHQGGYSKVAVENISDPGGTMVADLSVVADDLMYLSNIINDISGNGNGYADPGETIYLKLELLNLGADISYFEFTLSTDDLDITIVDSIAVYQAIMEDSIVWDTENDFVFTVDPEADYHPITFTVSGTDGANHTENYQFVVMMENLYVLLVDDSGGETDEFGKSIISYYEEALIQAGISYYSNWSIYSDGIPAIDILNNYRTLVWVTGSNQQTLGISEQAEIKDYLDNGGSLLITGQNIGKDLVSSGSESDSLFYANYLKAEYLADDPGVGSNILMTGIENDPISGGYRPYFYLSSGNSANNQTSPDIIAPINEATGAMEYFGTGVMGKKSGIKYEGDYRIVYYSFGIEGINEFVSLNITRADILKRSIGWLQEDPSIVLSVPEISAGILPMDFLLKQNYPNPFNSTTVIPYVLSDKGTVDMVIYDISGRQIRSYRQYHTAPGIYRFRWDGRNDRGKLVTSGIYLYCLRYKDQKHVKRFTLLK